ncbi:MAG: sulfur oxidation c-type cytochrome SoxX [Betaproteobacteria bacterium]|nr:sulfur oxidation c-type cytochrome SoxX [Betaproteobacteria bacterium]
MGLAVAANAAAADPAVLQYKVSGDTIATPLAAPGDALRGRDIVAGRDGNCLLCHAIPETGARFMGDIAPPLSGIGARLSAAQLRLRVVDQSRLNPDTVMPSYFKVDGLHRVAPAFRGKPILNAAQVEDVVAFLQTLK